MLWWLLGSKLKKHRLFWVFLTFSILLHIVLIISFENENKPTQTDEPNDKKTQNIGYVILKKEDIIIKKQKNKTKTKTKNIDKTENIKQKTKAEENNTKADNKLVLKLSSDSFEKKFENIDSKTREYLLLYGAEYFSYNDETKKYLKNNLSTIGRITQRYLRYPAISLKTKQSGQNIVEFYLHPNGDISNLKITKKSHFGALDKSSYETIKLAYKDYPTPKEKTKIRIYVKYIYR